MRTFVMGDIHGAHKALKQCLERAAFDRDKDVLMQLGDVADGSDEVYDCKKGDAKPVNEEMLQSRRISGKDIDTGHRFLSGHLSLLAP